MKFQNPDRVTSSAAPNQEMTSVYLSITYMTTATTTNNASTTMRDITINNTSMKQGMRFQLAYMVSYQLL